MKQAAGCYAVRWLLLLSGLALAGCHKQVPPLASHIHYEVGAAYMADGRWLYPRQEFAYRETGLAVMDTNTSPRLTADGEVYDPQAMAGAHPTLQLPIQVTVRNLDNGRQITVRLNDRGPAQRGRLLSLTPRAAQLLGMGQGPARVEVVEDELPSRVFAETLPGGPLLAMNAAPVETVREEALDAPGRQSTVAAPSAVQNAVGTPPVALPVLPATYVQNIPTAGSLWVETGRFTQRSYAAMEAAKAGGTVRYANDSRGPAWGVRVGPFQTVNEADTALDQALGLGLTGAHIVVE
ncbi:septal ring lytic transglycosylase RlpA family protein [Acetobacter sp.]|uniref:septal ring lytic transglycosylase RlpA family protein n=1 Tax=Acetobacter sp. TaxID=440 RepID=UPI0039E79D85